MTAMTLVAALASFIFLPLSQALIDAHGWRDALLVLAGLLAAVTIPLHATRPARRAATRPHRRGGELDRGSARAALVGLLAALSRLRARLVEHDRDDRSSRSRSCSSAATRPPSPRSPSA